MKASDLGPEAHGSAGPHPPTSWRRNAVWVALLLSTTVNLVVGFSKAGPIQPAPSVPGLVDSGLPEGDPRISQVATDLPIPVSIIGLIADPQVYAGKRIVVRGYLVRGFESDTLWLHKEDPEYSLLRNGIAVELPELDGGPWEGYVAIDGVFDPRPTMSTRGVITSITRVSPQSRRQTGDRDAR